MSRILSVDQKKDIFVNLPNSFTIDGVTFSGVSKKYANQLTLDEDTIFPVISLNYAQDGIHSEVVDAGQGMIYWKAMLTFHILAKSASGLNGAAICEGIADSIMTELKTWTTPLATGVMIVDDFDIMPVDNRGILQEFSGVFDYVFSVKLLHE